MALTKITGEGVGAVDDVTIEGHASVGVNAVDATRALTVAGSTDDSSASGLVVYNSSLASKFSVRNDGYITAAGDIQVGGSLYVGGTAAANALDDYEEGTFTPTLTGSSSNPSVTYSSQEGHYTKVGNLVSFQIRIHTSAYSGGSGNLYISGLPFTSSSSLDSYSGAVGLNYQFASNLNPMAWTINDNASFLTLWRNNNNADVVVTSNGAASLRIRLQGFYYT